MKKNENKRKTSIRMLLKKECGKYRVFIDISSKSKKSKGSFGVSKAVKGGFLDRIKAWKELDTNETFREIDDIKRILAAKSHQEELD